MKFIVMLLSLGIAIYMGFKGGIDKPKSTIWKFIVLIIVTIGVVLALLPPIAGNFSDAKRFPGIDNFKDVPVLLSVVPNSIQKVESLNHYEMTVESKTLYTLSHKYDSLPPVQQKMIVKATTLPSELESNQNLVLLVTYDTSAKSFIYLKTVAINPIITYPYIPALQERVRNISFHVPMHWIAVIAFLISMIYSVQYLRKKDLDYDTKAYSALAIGLTFALMGTTTGMVWAKFNWGSFWNWDPRQITIFVMILLYSAYFALRLSIDKEEVRARLSAVYSIISFATTPFLVFILPRMYKSLHPGGQGDGTVGPVMDAQNDVLDSSLGLTYYIMLMGLLLVFFWILNITIRKNLAEQKVVEE